MNKKHRSLSKNWKRFLPFISITLSLPLLISITLQFYFIVFVDVARIVALSFLFMISVILILYIRSQMTSKRSSKLAKTRNSYRFQIKNIIDRKRKLLFQRHRKK